MSTDLTIFQHDLGALAPRFDALLRATGVPVERFMQTIVVSCERTPRLLTPELRPSLFASAMTVAVLGLEADGPTGQAFLVPFGGRKPRVQPLVGYKGYNTLAARVGVTITGAVVREGDEFDYALGTTAFVHHKPLLTAPGERKIVAAWAVAAHRDRPPAVSILAIDDIMAIRAKSAAADKADSPWNDRGIGFAAMAEKSAKRRLARVVPLSAFTLAARIEEAVEEQGRPAYLREDGALVVDGQIAHPAPALAKTEPAPQPSVGDLTGGRWSYNRADGSRREFPSRATWQAYIEHGIDTTTDARVLAEIWERQADVLAVLDRVDPEAHTALAERYRARLTDLGGSP